MVTKGYKPCNGGGGPTLEQQNNNTKVLGQNLKKLNIPFKENLAYIEKLCGVRGELVLELEHPQTKKPIYTGYDRWGFVIEGPGMEDAVDQADLKYTVNEFKKMFNK